MENKENLFSHQQIDMLDEFLSVDMRCNRGACL